MSKDEQFVYHCPVEDKDIKIPWPLSIIWRAIQWIEKKCGMDVRTDAERKAELLRRSGYRSSAKADEEKKRNEQKQK